MMLVVLERWQAFQLVLSCVDDGVVRIPLLVGGSGGASRRGRRAARRSGGRCGGRPSYRLIDELELVHSDHDVMLAILRKPPTPMMTPVTFPDVSSRISLMSPTFSLALL